MHFLKNFRARLVTENKIVTFFDGNEENIITIQNISNILNIGKATDDISTIGKMRDSYVIQLFKFENIIKLIRNIRFCEATAFFPYACIVATIFRIHLDIEFRLFLVELAFKFFHDFLTEFPKLNKLNVNQKSSKGCLAVTIHEEHLSLSIWDIWTSVGCGKNFIWDNHLDM